MSEEYGEPIQKNKLDAVRDLIFGQKLSEYEAELSSIHQKISQNQERLNSELSAMRAQILESINNLESSAMHRIESAKSAAMDELRRQEAAHLSKENLGSILAEVSRKLSGNNY